MCPVFPTTFIEETTSAPAVCPCPFVILPTWAGLISGLCSVPLISVSVLPQYRTALITVALECTSVSRNINASDFVLPSQDYGGYLRSFTAPCTFLVCLFQFCETRRRQFDGGCTGSADRFRRYGKFPDISFSYP